MALIGNPAGRAGIRRLMAGTARLALQGGHEHPRPHQRLLKLLPWACHGRRASAIDLQIVISDD
jgi:hypothetical protein